MALLWIGVELACKIFHSYSSSDGFCLPWSACILSLIGCWSFHSVLPSNGLVNLLVESQNEYGKLVRRADGQFQ